MKTPYRDPVVEEGRHNLVWQNRAGNRCTLLCHEHEAELELVYKPNAFRRKDFRARNFSNRDNFSVLFERVWLPDWPAQAFREFFYDPFLTRIELETEAGAKNCLTVLNLVDENAFALSADRPLLICLRPRVAFEEGDGLLWEEAEERGEAWVNFVAFPGFEQNRYRVLDDGTHVLQLLEDDVLLLGAEESLGQMSRVLGKCGRRPVAELIAENEGILARELRHGVPSCWDPSWQCIVDLNRRIVWSGLDAGGACFGAINRIYHLIWVRDGSMTAAHCGRAGSPGALALWAPFLLANPSRARAEDGTRPPEFLQVVGSRWTKAEDDGTFYATWTAFSHFRHTGDDALLHAPCFTTLLEAIDRQIAKCWDPEQELFGSDTLGESTLPSSPYYGYDIVNGRPERQGHGVWSEFEAMARSFSFYHQVNNYNVLLMAVSLMRAVGSGDERAEGYLALAERLRDSLQEKFIDPAGKPYALMSIQHDRSERWISLEEESNFWEHGWAMAQGPFYPLPAEQLAGARYIVQRWPEVAAERGGRSYGISPWSVLTRFLAEHEGPDRVPELLQEVVDECHTQTERFPMTGALHESRNDVNLWRALPFSAGAFLAALSSQLLQSLACGLAVRPGGNLMSLRAFRHRLASIDVSARGTGAHVASYELNGRRWEFCLQVPESELHAGGNLLAIERTGSAARRCRLWASDAELLRAEESDGQLRAELRSAVPVTLWLENAAVARSLSARDGLGQAVRLDVQELGGTPLSVARVPESAGGRLTVEIANG